MHGVDQVLLDDAAFRLRQRLAAQRGPHRDAPVVGDRVVGTPDQSHRPGLASLRLRRVDPQQRQAIAGRQVSGWTPAGSVVAGSLAHPDQRLAGRG